MKPPLSFPFSFSSSLRAVSALACVLPLLFSSLAAQEKSDLRFSFGPKPIPGFTQVKPEEAYNVNRGYGFDLGSKVSVVTRDGGSADPLAAGFTIGDNGRPFLFSAKLPPGAWRVDVTLGDATAETVATVKTETRRLMLEAVHVLAQARVVVREARVVGLHVDEVHVVAPHVGQPARDGRHRRHLGIVG